MNSANTVAGFYVFAFIALFFWMLPELWTGRGGSPWYVRLAFATLTLMIISGGILTILHP